VPHKNVLTETLFILTVEVEPEELGTATETMNQRGVWILFGRPVCMWWQTGLYYIHVQCPIYITGVEKCLNKGHVTAKWINHSVISLNNLYLCWNTYENISYILYINY